VEGGWTSMDEKGALAAVDASLETLEDGCRELRELFEAFVPLIESLRAISWKLSA
jgi:hypothetical protein